MAATIKMIAELSGFSRGTVDRVLNNRGKVNAEKEALVRSIAEQLGYKPNLAGKTLAARKRAMVIGIILVSDGNPFFDAVLEGIYQEAAKLEDYGVRIMLRTMRGYGEDEQLALMEELEGRINALIISPISAPRVAAKICALDAHGVGVITLNTDIENSARFCYVGCNYVNGGEMACGIMGLLTGGTAKLGLITGTVKNLGHSQRIAGLRAVMRGKYPAMSVLDYTENEDDDQRAFEVTRAMLTAHPEIDALCIVAAGAWGACRAVMSLNPVKKLTIVTFDDVPTTAEMIKNGLVQATICQRPHAQGELAVRVAFDYLICGVKPKTDQVIVENEIKIAENI